MSNKLRFSLWLTLITLLLIGVFTSNRFNVETNLLNLLPQKQYDPFVDLAFEKFANQNMQELVFVIEGDSFSDAKLAIKQLHQLLAKSRWVANVNSDISQQQQQDMAAINFKYRFQLLSSADAKLIENKSFSSFSEELVNQLYSPVNGGVSALVETDPLLLSYRYSLQNIQRTQNQFQVRDGYLAAQQHGKNYLLLTATLNDSPFLPALQNELVGQIKLLADSWENSGLKLNNTGAVFYAAAAYKTANQEISTIGVGSLLMILLLISYVFRSLLPIVLVSIALATGIACGFLLVHQIYGQVHLLTLVFGASLIGVAVDYAFHFLSVEPAEKSKPRIQRIFSAITLGLISSVVGYMALFVTPFPGLRQMAIFCSAGLVGAYLSVLWLFPVFQLEVCGTAASLKLCNRILKSCTGIGVKSLTVLTLAVPLIGLSLYHLTPQTNDDIRQFQSKNIALESQRETIETLLQAPAANQFYLVKGDSAEKLLINLEKASFHLQKLVSAGVIDDFQSIVQWLPSKAKQQQNFTHYQKLYASSVFSQLIEYGIYQQSEVNDFQQDFSQYATHYLTPNEWLDSELGKRYASLWLGQLQGEYAAIIALKGINRLADLASINDDIIFVDKVSNISNLFQQYREITSILLLTALSLIFLVLFIRYSFTKALIIISSPIIAISFTVIILIILGEQVNLFNTLAFFLVVGIGIDYGLFFAESEQAKASTLLAIVLSAMTTLFSFGLLSLSETAAIHAFGITMLVGISSVFILSPFIGNLVVTLGNKKNVIVK